MRLVMLAVVVLVSVTACEPTRGSGITPPPPVETTAGTAPPPSQPVTSTTLPPSSACPEGDVMLSDGQLVQWERPEADGSRIASISWRTTGDCQLVTLSFASDDGAPATTPPTMTARLVRDAGILRIDTAATSSVVVDQLVESGLIRQLYVPVTVQGSRFVDLVLGGPVVGRARLLTSPARLEIELQPGGPPEIGSPLVTRDLVLVQPGRGATVSPVLDISGYASDSTQSLTFLVRRFGLDVTSSSLELEPQPGMWTGFSTVIQVGDQPYDSLAVLDGAGSVLAGIPISP